MSSPADHPAEASTQPVKSFGRTGEWVSPIWRERADGLIEAGAADDTIWHGLVLGPDDLDRRGGQRLRDRAAALGRAFEFVVLRDLLANDLKVGWPLHRLQRLRDERLNGDPLFRWIIVDANDVLEAEWIAANAPVHGVIIKYDPSDMAARYRVFAAAANARVALIGHGTTPEAVALQLATPQITATLLPPGVDDIVQPISSEAVEQAWAAYAASHAEPPKLRGGHPPDFGS